MTPKDASLLTSNEPDDIDPGLLQDSYAFTYLKVGWFHRPNVYAFALGLNDAIAASLQGASKSAENRFLEAKLSL